MTWQPDSTTALATIPGGVELVLDNVGLDHESYYKELDIRFAALLRSAYEREGVKSVR